MRRAQCGQHDVGMSHSVVVVDDHLPFLQAASAALRAAGWEVLAGAADGPSAIAAVHELEPDVVLLDVQLLDTNGFEVARELRALPTPPTVVLISGRAATDYGDEISRSGARGFLDKTDFTAAALDELLRGPV